MIAGSELSFTSPLKVTPSYFETMDVALMKPPEMDPTPDWPTSTLRGWRSGAR